MDPGFYSADYLRAWVRSAQLRRYLIETVGADWWRNPATGDFLRELFREGTKPSSEEIARADRLRPARHGAAAPRARRCLILAEQVPQVVADELQRVRHHAQLVEHARVVVR